MKIINCNKRLTIIVLLLNTIIINGKSQTTQVTSEYWNVKAYEEYWEEYGEFPVKTLSSTDSISIVCQNTVFKNTYLKTARTNIDCLELELTITNNSANDIHLPSLESKLCADIYEVIKAIDYNKLMQEDVRNKELGFNFNRDVAGPYKYRFSYLGNIIDYGYSNSVEKDYVIIKRNSVSNVFCLIPMPTRPKGQYLISLVASTIEKRGLVSHFINSNLSIGMTLIVEEKIDNK